MNNFINEIGNTKKSCQLALKNIIEKWKSSLIALIERGKAEGAIKESTNNEAVATFLISSFEGIRGIRKLYDDDQIINDYIKGISNYLQQLKP